MKLYSLLKIIILFFLIPCLYIQTWYANDGIEVKVSTDLSPILSSCSWDTCVVGKWASAFQELAGSLIRYATFIILLFAVLFIVVNGILYSMSWINEWLKSSAKDRIIKMLIGIVLLLLSGFILNTLAPWIYNF